MKTLFMTLCAAAITVAQPALSDQSEDILGSWECQLTSEIFSGTTHFTFLPDGTGYNNWDVSSESQRRAADSEITWHIAAGILYHHHIHSTLRNFEMNGNDHTDRLLGNSLLRNFMWKPPEHEDGSPAAIISLTSDSLVIVSQDGKWRENCTRPRVS